MTKCIVPQVLSAHPEPYMPHTYDGLSQDLNSFLRQCSQRRGVSPWPTRSAFSRYSASSSRSAALRMRSRRFVWDPEHWRFRAEEARTVADQMTHEGARTIMRRIAMDYDRLAKLAEEQLADQERGTIDD